MVYIVIQDHCAPYFISWNRTEWTNTNQPRPNSNGIFYFLHPNTLVCPKSNHHIFDQICIDIYNTNRHTTRMFHDQVSWCLFVARGIQELILIQKKLSTEYRMTQQQRSTNFVNKKHPCTSRLTMKAIHKQNNFDTEDTWNT